VVGGNKQLKSNKIFDFHNHVRSKALGYTFYMCYPICIVPEQQQTIFVLSSNIARTTRAMKIKKEEFYF